MRACGESRGDGHGLRMFDVQLRRESTGWVVRVFIDRPGPSGTPEDSVGVEDCGAVSRGSAPFSMSRRAARPCVHPRGVVARPRSAPARRARLPALRRPAREDRPRRAHGRPVGVRRTAPRRGRRHARLRGRGTEWHRIALTNIKRARLDVELRDIMTTNPLQQTIEALAKEKGHRARRDHHGHRGRGPRPPRASTTRRTRT